MVKIQTFTKRLTGEEMETSINYGAVNATGEYDTVVCTTRMPDYRKLMKREWVLVEQFQYDDGTVCGGKFVGNHRDLSFKNPNRIKRTLTEEQRTAAAQRLAEYRSGSEDDEEDEDENEDVG